MGVSADKKKRGVPLFLERVWETDIPLTALLLSILFYIFFVYPVGQIGTFTLLPTIFLTFILITGAITVSTNRIFRTLVISCALLTVTLIWIRYAFPHKNLVSIANWLGLFFLSLLTSLILRQAFREGPTTYHRIMGAIAAYLLMGMIWYEAYFLVTLHIPDAFKIQGSFTPEGGETLQSRLFYFSMVSLTLGTTDIAPVHPIARMLVMLEGFVGQLFPVILIARLVSLNIRSKQRHKAADEI